MVNDNIVELLFELLQSGDEALDFLCESLNNNNADACIVVTESLEELYENIALCIKNHDINEKHRGWEAAQNATLAAGKLKKICIDTNIDSAVLLLTYELIPLHVFLSNELYFWFSIYPDTGKMHEYRDRLLEDVKGYFHQHDKVLKMEYAYDVSIMVLCYNNVNVTKTAYKSLLKYTNFEKFKVEILLVNNGSDDNGETSAFIEEISDQRVKTVNLMHPMGYNAYSLGPVAAQGRYFVEFHTDVIATENWLDNLINCISSDSDIGAAVAVCNSSSNFQSIPVTYADPKKDDTELQNFASKFNHPDPLKWEHRARIMPTSGYIIPTALYRQLLRDPWLYYGQFTDDDMSMYMRRSGFKQVVAKDTFLHHFGSLTSSHDIIASNSINNTRKRFYEKWGVDAWYGSEKNHYAVEYINQQDIQGFESFLFIDPLFGSTPMFINNELKKKKISFGEINVLISDPCYSKDASYYCDTVLTGCILETLNKIDREYDYIVFHPDISEYIDKDFPKLLKVLRRLSKPGAKVVFTLANPSYYMNLYELAKGIISQKSYEPWKGIHFFDYEYISATAYEQGFNCTVGMASAVLYEQDKPVINHFQALTKDAAIAESMTCMMRLFVLNPT